MNKMYKTQIKRFMRVIAWLLLLTIVAKILQLHRNSIIKLIKSKKLQPVKIGKLYRITDKQLEQFFNLSGAK